MVSYVQVPSQQGKENVFIEEKRKLGERAVVNRESMASHWLSPCQERKGVFFLMGLCYCHRA